MPFICTVFDHFHSKKRVWGQITSCLAELDCLCSLALTSSAEDVCRPRFISLEENKFTPYIEVR